MSVLLHDIAFRDRPRATSQLFRLSENIPRGIIDRIQQQLAASADPDGALQLLVQFATQHADVFQRISQQPMALQDLVTLFSHSQFLALETVQHPEWLDADLKKAWQPVDFHEAASAALTDIAPEKLALTLAMFRRRQYLRILLRDVQGLATLAETTADLSHLADAILEAAYRHVRSQIEAKFGPSNAQFSVIALGKLGGQELNYSSDIDLMFVFDQGDTEFFRKVANAFTGLLSTYTAEGLCYRVDLRLRPEGRLGEVAISLEGARQYYRHRARDWELQMLIKARVAAGDRGPGEAVLAFADPLIYSTTLDFTAVESVSEARMRIHEKATQKRNQNTTFDIKLMPGGIRDIEFLAQCLQRLHGGREPWVRHGGTLLALTRLRDKELLSASEYSDLSSAYEFLRHLEHRLQAVDDRQTHTLPSKPEELAILAKRMPPDEIGGSPSEEKLFGTLTNHLERVQQLYERVIHAQKPIYYGIFVESGTTASDLASDNEIRPLASNLIRFLDQSAPRLASLISGRPTLQSPAFELFLERLQQRPEWLSQLNEDSAAAGYLVDIFEYSPWLADALNRDAELTLTLFALTESRVREGFQEASGDVRLLRQTFRREMFRILAESLCLQTPIFETLLKTSALADTVIEAAYRMAIDQVRTAHAPKNPEYQPGQRMMVVALGRLGMLEFDLASDADLIFVLPDAEESEIIFWTRVAERLIDILTAYTGDGTLIAVDTRLRPGGRDGQLVQLEKGYKEYFDKQAEAWEGISYMKARAVAGDAERTTTFLAELQKIDWRRYGQSGRSRKQLSDMRMRLEKEQGPANELKAGHGGYYDIDFALMYLRLKGAGIFFKALNTPERIDIVEQMGHLEPTDAHFLRDAATFYRAIDHGIRLQTGHSAGSLPTSSIRLQQLATMVRRWTPEGMQQSPIQTELSLIQSSTREYFDRLFSDR